MLCSRLVEKKVTRTRSFWKEKKKKKEASYALLIKIII